MWSCGFVGFDEVVAAGEGEAVGGGEVSFEGQKRLEVLAEGIEVGDLPGGDAEQVNEVFGQ